MKRKLISVAALIITVISLGHLFFWSCLLGFLLSGYVSSRSPGKRGKFKSVIIPFLRWRLHLHHWLYSACLMVVATMFNVHLIAPVITYGILGGFIFQGIYRYSDWYVVISNRG